MCSTRGRRVGLDSDPLRRPPPSPVKPSPPVSQFVKVVLDSTLETKKLRIPPRFVKSGPELSDTVTLETPVGFKREIGVKRVGDDEVWFQEGWSEFAEHHSIKRGHMLLFDFRGDSSFRVLIFDMSATEAEYAREFVRIDHSDDEEMEDVCVDGETKAEGFIGYRGIEKEEDDVIDVSVESDVKQVSRSNPGSGAGKRKEIVSLIDDSDEEVTELEGLLQTRTGGRKNVRRINSEPTRRVGRRDRDSQLKKSLTRNGRGQFAKCLDMMDIEVLDDDEVVHKQGASKPSKREKKQA